MYILFFFFFQAEDGIRDLYVTGVQTCALPIFQLLGIGANPDATQVKWVRAYSRVHGMMHKWRFLTGPLPEMKRVWRAFGIEAQVFRGQIDHTPATYVIDRHGRLSRLYLTQMA